NSYLVSMLWPGPAAHSQRSEGRISDLRVSCLWLGMVSRPASGDRLSTYRELEKPQNDSLPLSRLGGSGVPESHVPEDGAVPSLWRHDAGGVRLPRAIRCTWHPSQM